jgi:hypothetical protein
MATRTLTPQEAAAKDARPKSVLDYIKEGMTSEEARAAVQANRNK